MSPAPRHGTIVCASPSGTHRMAYVEWGDPDNPRVLVCVHGLSRTGRDFDVLASRMAQTHRVICPDVVGRGKSDWLRDPAGYILPQYVGDMLALFTQLHLTRLAYVGTSMGGLIGMLLAAMPITPIARMVINDVGPHIEPSSLLRLRAYLDEVATRNVTAAAPSEAASGAPRQTPAMPMFATAQEGVDYLVAHSTGFGPHTPEQWRALNAPLLKRVYGADGGIAGYAIRADPGIADAFKMAATLDAAMLEAAEAGMWHAFESIRCPTLIVRGAESDLFSAQTLARMLACGPRFSSVTVPGVGHAPTFVDPAQTGLLTQFLHAS
ncbi:alpha/beta hydrolase [Robbsia sp. KACC 23696]|uniref:alpha/beta fold hydrolase n=1 Tax=Robbsia sp. KACC 23696 TaxID=3149231 RepID=UPI00325C1E56